MGPQFELDGEVGSAKLAPTALRWRAGIGSVIRLVFALACILALIDRSNEGVA
jgi:hypothetical protein